MHLSIGKGFESRSIGAVETDISLGRRVAVLVNNVEHVLARYAALPTSLPFDVVHFLETFLVADDAAEDTSRSNECAAVDVSEAFREVGDTINETRLQH